ncbi:MAG: hypothetical protein ABIL68_16230 [bacterium]
MNFIITLIILIFIIAVLSLCLWVTRKSRFGKGSPTAMGQFVGEQLLLVNKDQRRAVEEVIYQREDKRKEDDEGEDVWRFEE